MDTTVREPRCNHVSLCDKNVLDVIRRALYTRMYFDWKAAQGHRAVGVRSQMCSGVRCQRDVRVLGMTHLVFEDFGFLLRCAKIIQPVTGRLDREGHKVQQLLHPICLRTLLLHVQRGLTPPTIHGDHARGLWPIMVPGRV